MTTIQERLGEYGEVWIAIKGFVYGAFVFMDIDINVVSLLMILMGVDTVLGVFKAIILKQTKFTFKKLIWGIITKVSVLIIPMVLALTAKAINLDFTWVVTSVLDILVVAEAFSAISNILSIKERKEYESTDFITGLLKRLRNAFRNIIDNIGAQIDPTKEEENE